MTTTATDNKIPETIQRYKKALVESEPSYAILSSAASAVVSHSAVRQYLRQVDHAYTNHLYGKHYTQAITTLPQEALKAVATDYGISTDQVEDLYRLRLID